MPDEIRFTSEQFETLHAHLLKDSSEQAAILLCGKVDLDDHFVLTCREVVVLKEDDLLSSGALHLEVSPVSIARMLKRARALGLTLVMTHSHPFGGRVAPSRIDIVTEAQLCGRVLSSRLNGYPTGSLILGPDGYSARLWKDGRSRPLQIRVAGKRLSDKIDIPQLAESDEVDARSLLVWGPEGQAILRCSSIAVVGLGGTGSHVASQLARLGVQRLILVDPDKVETTNLSRLVGSRSSDVGRKKVEVAARYVSEIRRDVEVECIPTSVLEIDPHQIADCDLIICCTDGHGSRTLLTQLAAQYLITLIDLGVEIQPAASATRAGGGVRVMRPGEPCLHCMGIIDPALVREEFLSDELRNIEQNRGYLRGSSEPAPSVVALNGVVASLAVLEAIDELVEIFAKNPNRLLYRAEMRALTTASATSDAECFVCGQNGIVGMGDARNLPLKVAPSRIVS